MLPHQLKVPKGSRRRRKIVGRGPGSGHGKTSTRGQKGQTSRAGRGILRSLEGGQIPLVRRIPKVGFNSKNPILYQLVKLDDLSSSFIAGQVVTPVMLKARGLIKSIYRPFKVLGNGEIKHALTIQAYAFSGSALAKIEKAGGKIEKIDQKIVKQSQVGEKK